MMRQITSVGCSLALVVGSAGFLGCEEEGLQVDEGMYGTETEVNDGLDTRAPALDGTGVGLDTESMYRPGAAGSESIPDTQGQEMDRPGTTPPQDLNQQPNTPTIPHTTPDDHRVPGTPGMPGSDQTSMPTSPQGGM